MLNNSQNFICLKCDNVFQKECKHVAIDNEKKQTECDDALLSCSKCKSNSVVPFETRKYKVIIEWEYSLDISPVENDTIHSECDGTDEEILKSIISDSLEGTVSGYQFLKYEKEQAQKWIL